MIERNRDPARERDDMTSMPPLDQEVTRLLHAANDGDRDALEASLRQLYAALHRIADSHLRGEYDQQTLNATALVNEAYLRLFSGGPLPVWKNRGHLLGLASHAMRQLLISAARRRKAAKRPQRENAVDLTQAALHLAGPAGPDALDMALLQLQKINDRWLRIVEMRFFAGLNAEQTGAALGISASTVKREWRMARAWLRRELSVDEH